MKLVFVILHYQNIDVTEKCIQLLMKLNDIENSNIVIVDNASSNGSGEYLKDKYKLKHNVDVLINSENSGFANGNNIGYSFAKNNLHADIIVVMNSDIFIEDKDFISKVKREFEKENVDIVAPDIYALKGYYQNPLAQRALTLQEVKKWYAKVCILNAGVNIPLVGQYIAEALQKKHDKNDQVKAKKNYVDRPKQYDIVAHGACVIFGKRWIDNEVVAFMPYTFMYCEEYLLAYYISKKKYKTMFSPEIQVVHEAGASRKADDSKVLGQMKFFYKNEKKSISELLKLMKGIIKI